MRSLILFVLCAALPACLSAQTANTFFSTFDAERGDVLTSASDGNLWLGGMLDEQVLLVKISPDGKLLQQHRINFLGTGLDSEHLVDLLEDEDGMLVGCGFFESDNAGRGFAFRYNPATRQMVWSHLVQSGIDFVYGITELGPGGDFVLYDNPHFAGNDDAELLQLQRKTGQIVPGKAWRYNLGPSDNFTQLIYHEGALYACGRFTGNEPYPPARMRSTICKLDTAAFQPVWANLGPLPTSSSGQFHGRDLIIEDGAVLSTFSGDHVSPDLEKSEVYLQKSDLDGNLLWIKQYKLPEFKGEFAEELISLPDGYMLFGFDKLTDTSRYFLLKTDKNGNPLKAVKIDFGYNDAFPEIPARSKILRLGNALFLTAMSQNDVGQTQGILAKTDLDGWVNDSCGFFRATPVTGADWSPLADHFFVPTTTPSAVTLAATSQVLNTPDVMFTKQCGATGTCPTLPDIQLHLDSITCTNGEPLLHYSFCNVGGQPYEGVLFFGLYDKNPFIDSAQLLTVVIYTSFKLPPGDCVTQLIQPSNPFPPMAFQLDTFQRLYGMLGINLNTPTPFDLSKFPFSPNGQECGYFNNMDSISVPAQLCGTCAEPSTFVKRLGSAKRPEQGFSMCASKDGNVYLAGSVGGNFMLSKITPNGKQIWTRDFPGSIPNQPVAIAEIIEDSDGKLVFCGTQDESPTQSRVIVMRYDPVADMVLWYKHLAVYNYDATDLTEISPGGNFILHAQSELFFNGELHVRPDLVELDRTTGVRVLGSPITQRFQGAPSLIFESAAKRQDNLYTVGQWQSNSAHQAIFTKISLADGQLKSAYLTNADTTAATPVEFSHKTFALDEDQTIIAGCGPKSPGSQEQYLYLQKHNNDNFVWLKRYDISMVPEDVVALYNAYLIFGKMANNRWGMLKVDKLGNVLLAKTLTTGGSAANSTFPPYRQGQFLRTGDHVLMLDYEQRNGSSDILLVKTDLNFNLHQGDTCNLFQTIHVDVRNMPAKVEPFALSNSNFSPNTSDAGVLFQSDTLEARNLCPQCACTDRPDITYSIDSVYCVPGTGVVARVSICNLGQAAPADSFPVSFYSKNPLTEASSALYTAVVPDQPAPGACLKLVLPLNPALLAYGKIYTLAGAGSNLPTPLSVLDFPLPDGFEECNYANNLDSFEITLPAPQKPDLGPDRVLCSGQTATLDAGGGYVAYQWQNGPAAPVFTANVTGNYIVEVTDACGRELRDTVQVTVLPTIPPTTNTLVVPAGGTIVINGQTYTQPDTVVQHLTTAAGCDSVVTTILQFLPDDKACDVKTPPGCLRYELLNIHFDGLGQRVYRIRVTNTCASPLLYTCMQLPKGVTAVAPKEASGFTAASGHTYSVRNPNESPFYSIRFKAVAGTLNNGASDIFEFTLPRQSAPEYIHVAGKLADGSGSEAHLNTFNCPVQPYNGSKSAARNQPDGQASVQPARLAVWPNPTGGDLFVALPAGPEGIAQVQIGVWNAQGKQVLEQNCGVAREGFPLELPAGWSNGMYYLSVQPEGGIPMIARFVLER